MVIDFRRLDDCDMGRMHEWMNTDFVIEWYEKRPMTMDAVKDKYQPKIAGEEPTEAFIIVADGREIGYIQTYKISDYPDYNRYVQADDRAAGVDLFIGHRDYIHKGHGSDIMRAFLQRHVFSKPRVNRCIIGPEPDNHSAIRMYEKAGFRWYKNIQIPDEDAPEYLMVLTRVEFSQEINETDAANRPL